VAVLSDCFHEVNGVGRTVREWDSFARRRGLPFFNLHVGTATRLFTRGSVTSLELKRSPLAFAIDPDLLFDPLFLRYRGRARRALEQFRPDLIHVLAPGDCGILGAVLARDLQVPLAASWHTNLHEYAARRLGKPLCWLPEQLRRCLEAASEQFVLKCVLRFYSMAALLMAPNPELMALLEKGTGKPVFTMGRGVDTALFSPSHRSRDGGSFVLGYVGRLTPEKNVRFLSVLQRELEAAGARDFRFLIVGQGSERGWLEENLNRVEFTGVLNGEALARAYANMDLFVFPSSTDTFGNVVQEALASGVPAVVTTGGGPKFIVQHGVTGLVASSDVGFIAAVRLLMRNRALRTRMREAARQNALSATWDSIFENLFATYAGFFSQPLTRPVPPKPCPLVPVGTGG
jgi:glycosyltransferase involved in cell wall biosynthesis